MTEARHTDYFFWMKEKIFSVIEKSGNCLVSDLMAEFHKSGPCIRYYLRFLIEEERIEAARVRGNLKRFYRRGTVPKRPICNFCGQPIQENPKKFNIFFPEIIYCSKDCLDKRVPRFSTNDLYLLGTVIEQLRSSRSQNVLQRRVGETLDL